MKLMKRKDSQDSIRKVWNDEKTVAYGIVGTVKDLTDIGVLEYCSYSPDGWAFIPFSDDGNSAVFGMTREKVLESI